MKALNPTKLRRNSGDGHIYLPSPTPRTVDKTFHGILRLFSLITIVQ